VHFETENSNFIIILTMSPTITLSNFKNAGIVLKYMHICIS